MNEQYIGLDYGMGQSNRDKDNPDFHYGIITVNDIPYIWDSLESNYGDPYCPKCDTEAKDYGDIYNAADEISQEDIDTWETSNGCSDYICEACQYIFDSQEAFPDEAINHTYEDEQYSMMADTDGDLWIFKSPYFTFTAYCSPCAPGAGDLRALHSNGIKTYCLGIEWWPEESDMPDQICEYPIYSVETGKCLYSLKNVEDNN